MLCQSLLSFHGLIEELRWKKSETESCEPRQERAIMTKVKTKNKEKQKGDEKGIQQETERVQRECLLFTIVCARARCENQLSEPHCRL